MTTKNHTLKLCAVGLTLLQTNMTWASCGCPSQQHTTKPAETSSNRWGVQASIVDSGTTSIGVVNYGECHSAGFNVSGFLRTNGKSTNVFSPAFFGGPRFKVRENTYFAFGVDISTDIGKKDGRSINSSVNVGPYVSIEYQPVSHIVLSAWINPYTYQNQRIGGQRTTTHKFAAGGIGISYLF
ncbi:hypothetical protein [Candidatus Finniella inopinata]|uniref:Outer membrane protein beta-barrel domain-containing protein n=1 Tax=Candidatus Finniella inopinata TaxID=1696036 RepID=A0A4Q7DNV1_9PROT|nr:hypothetical protein [Candidatus Finniella inopinata]RZI46606.1 hypothetical protein EQU50_03190 [Candidatus Finniella inopinata]